MTVPDRTLAEFRSALAGHYAIERELGRGGMGIVYLARDVRLERLVAIKLLPPALGSQGDLRARLLEEARTAAQLSHPHIIPIHAVEEAPGFAYFVMAFVEGETLGARIRARGALPPLDVARVLREVAWALAYGHARGVLHRDVKPDNVLLEDATGRALVADYGIARRTRGDGTASAAEVTGTPEFMSPEQASGGPLDGRSDLYSLGIVGYYALAGRLPFAGRTVAEVLAQQIGRSPPPLAAAAPRAPGPLVEIVEHCLAKDPEARFASGEALVEALDRRVMTRRELPMPVRAFVAEGRGGKSRRLFTAWLAALALVPSGLWMLVWLTFRGKPPEPYFLGIVGVALLLALLTLLMPLVSLVERARRLRAAGYGRAVLLDALRAELEDRRDELAYAAGSRGAKPRLERVARILAYSSVAVAALTGALSFVVPYPSILVVFATFGAAAATAVVAGIVARELGGRRGARAEERRWSFWAGWVGDLLFKLAGRRSP